MDDDMPQDDVVHAEDVHPTDVLLRWGSNGHEWFSCIKLPHRGLVLVQNVDGVHFYMPVHQFAKRYALAATGPFNIVWRFSPIAAVSAYHGGPPTSSCQT